MPAGEQSAAAQSRALGNLRGIGWMILTGVLFVGVTGIVRHLGTDMAPVQAAFIRYAIGVALLIPVLIRLGRVRFTKQTFRLHVLRGIVHGIGVMLWFFAWRGSPSPRLRR